jgi:hypothetical protein
MRWGRWRGGRVRRGGGSGGGSGTPNSNQKQSFLSCVKSGSDYFSLQNGLVGLTGGRVGTGWLSSVFLGSNVSSGITLLQWGGSFLSGSGPSAGRGAGSAVSLFNGNAASALAKSVPNVSLGVSGAVAVTVETPAAFTTVSVAGSVSAAIPFGQVATAAANGLNVFNKVKLPIDLAVGGFSAVVCSIGR